MHIDMIISQDEIDHAKREVRKLGIGPSMARLQQIEPALHNAIRDGAMTIWGVIEECHVDGHIDPKLVELLVELAMVAVQSIRRAQYRLWCDDFRDSRLAQIDPALRSPKLDGPGYL